MARALELVQQDPAKVGATEWMFAREIVVLDAWIKTRPIVELQAVQVGPVVLLACPAE